MYFKTASAVFPLPVKVFLLIFILRLMSLAYKVYFEVGTESLKDHTRPAFGVESES